jgi:hypothetical protein
MEQPRPAFHPGMHYIQQYEKKFLTKYMKATIPKRANNSVIK